jgi:hypothetical protein
VKRLFEDMLWKHGIRKEKKKRHEFSIHSVRKFFRTRAEQVMKPINVETLMGHSTGVSDSYYRPTEKELLEDYLREVRLAQLEGLVSQLVGEKGEQVLSRGRSRSKGTSKGKSSSKVVKS